MNILVKLKDAIWTNTLCIMQILQRLFTNYSDR